MKNNVTCCCGPDDEGPKRKLSEREAVERAIQQAKRNEKAYTQAEVDELERKWLNDNYKAYEQRDAALSVIELLVSRRIKDFLDRMKRQNEENEDTKGSK